MSWPPNRQLTRRGKLERVVWIASVDKAGAPAVVSEPGAVFGELSMLLDQPHTADVRLCRPRSSASLARQPLLTDDPATVLYVTVLLARRLDATNRALIEVKRQLQTGQPRKMISKTVEKAEELLNYSGRMMVTIIAGIATFERELIQERVRSGMAAAKARGQKLGRQPGQRPKADRLAPKVLALVAQKRSYRLIGRELGLSKNTVAAIVKRHRPTGSVSA